VVASDAPLLREMAEPPTKKAKVSAAGTDQAAHGLIDLAKEGNWEQLYEALDGQKELVNARPKVREYAILHQAAFHGDVSIVTSLIENYGADPAVLTKSGQSVLQVAKECGHADIVALLSSRLTGEPDHDRVLTPEKVAKADHTACKITAIPKLTTGVIQEGHKLIDFAKDARWEEIFLMLDKRPELVNVRPAVRDFSVLHQAAYHGDLKAATTLIEKYGADPNQLTKGAKSVAEVADEQGHSELAEKIRSFAGPEADDDDLDFVQMPDGSWKVVQKGAAKVAATTAAVTAASPTGTDDDLDFVQMPDGSWKVAQKGAATVPATTAVTTAVTAVAPAVTAATPVAHATPAAAVPATTAAAVTAEAPVVTTATDALAASASKKPLKSPASTSKKALKSPPSVPKGGGLARFFAPKTGGS